MHAQRGSIRCRQCKKRENETCDLVILLIQREMASVKQVDFGVWQIALERLCPSRNERWIVFVPRLPKWGACAHATTLATPDTKRRLCGSRTADPPGSRVARVLRGGRTRQSRYPDYNGRDARCQEYDAVRSLSATRTYRTLQDVLLDRPNTARYLPTWRPAPPYRHWHSG